MDLSQGRTSELLVFAETQAQIEQESPMPDDPDQDASWVATLALLRYLKLHGVPEALRDDV